ncbi:MAG: hypothetical protein OEW83_11780, partial [Acidimicrobiia bacterium]|nr:hypothetical protein [Acidimicrobiia bacterium]
MTINQPSSRLGDGPADPGLAESVANMMNVAWTEPGFCVPNGAVYPHQWLWDSCFHSVIWTTLDLSRALLEVDNVLSMIGPTGFVPHMTYWTDPDAHAGMWGRSRTSSITQPPIWGLALSEIAAGGRAIDDGLLDRATRGLLHLLEDRPRSGDGLVPVLHPWETGCDDSARWDGWATTPFFSPPFDRVGWKADKVRLVGSLVFDDGGAPVDNPDFAVGSVGFSALVAWNCELLAPLVAASGHPGVAARAGKLNDGREELVTAIRSRWDDGRRTWWDEPLRDGVRPSCGARTLDSMLALLVDPRPEMFDQLVDPEAFGAPFGPRGVHRAEAS